MNYRTCFASYLRRQGKRPATISNYTYALNDYKDYCHRTGKQKSLLKNFQPRQLETYRDFLLSTCGLRPSTVNHRLTALSALARFLMERGLLAYNPLELVTRVRNNGTSKAQPQASWEEVQELRREVNLDVLDVRGRLIVEFLYTGITVRELGSLRWDEQTSGNSLQIADRRINLHPEAQLAMKHYLILRPILKGSYLIAGNGANGSIKPSAVYAVMRRLSRKIGAAVRTIDLRLAQFAMDSSNFATAPSPEKMAA